MFMKKVSIYHLIIFNIVILMTVSLSSFASSKFTCHMLTQNLLKVKENLMSYLTTNTKQWTKMRNSEAFLQEIHTEVVKNMEKDADRFLYRGMNLSIDGLVEILSKGMKVDDSSSEFDGVLWFAENPAYAVRRTIGSWKGGGERLGVVFKVKKDNVPEINIETKVLQGGDKTFEVSKDIELEDILEIYLYMPEADLLDEMFMPLLEVI